MTNQEIMLLLCKGVDLKFSVQRAYMTAGFVVVVSQRGDLSRETINTVRNPDKSRVFLTMDSVYNTIVNIFGRGFTVDSGN